MLCPRDCDTHADIELVRELILRGGCPWTKTAEFEEPICIATSFKAPELYKAMLEQAAPLSRGSTSEESSTIARALAVAKSVRQAFCVGRDTRAYTILQWHRKHGGSMATKSARLVLQSALDSGGLTAVEFIVKSRLIYRAAPNCEGFRTPGYCGKEGCRLR